MSLYSAPVVGILLLCPGTLLPVASHSTSGGPAFCLRGPQFCFPVSHNSTSAAQDFSSHSTFYLPKGSLSPSRFCFSVPNVQYYVTKAHYYHIQANIPSNSRTKTLILCSKSLKTRVPTLKAHKNLDFVLEKPENGGFRPQKRTKTSILYSKCPKTGVPNPKSAQKTRFRARNARKRGFQTPKAHKKPDFVLGKMERWHRES